MMTLGRRSLLAAAVLALPAGAQAQLFRRRRREPPGCKGRVAYAGPPLRAQIGAWEFDAARQAGRSRLQVVIGDALETLFEQAAQGRTVGAITAAVAYPDGALWTQTHAADREAPLPRLFNWGGLSQACVATAVLQLVEEGKLTLAATADRWAPETPNAAWMTIEDLLTHTAGAGQAATVCPGAAFAPSDAGYALLGRIVEAVDGKPLHEALKQRITDRLELRDTVFPAPGLPVDGLAPGSPEATAGAVAASAADVVRVWRALFAERLHGEALTRGRFTRLYPLGATPGFYGQGVMVSDLPAQGNAPADVWLGFSAPQACVAYSVPKRSFVAVALTGEGAAEPVASTLLTAPPPPRL